MDAVVVHAHPVPDSYSGAVLDAVLDGLGPGADLFRLGDGREPGPTADRLRAADTLVFVHPTWWGGPPAVLLEWIQRTLAPWIDAHPIEPSPLGGVQRLAAVTTHGSSALVNRLQGEPGRHLVGRPIRRLCHRGVTWKWIALYGMDGSTEAERADFLHRARHDIAALVAPARS